MDYPWKRFWSLRNGRVALDAAGYLLDPDGRYGPVLNPDAKTYTQIEAIPCVVLLGEPGIGKSTAIAQIVRDAQPTNVHLVDFRDYGAEDRVIRAVFEALWWQSWQQGSSHLTVFFDSLDEGLLRISHLARVISVGLRGNTNAGQLQRLAVRIVCRTAEWPSSFETQLKTIFGDDRTSVYELMPLRLIDAANAARLNRIDADQFTAEIERAGVGPLAAKPITLEFLIKEFRKRGGSLPRSKTDLYEAGCLHLCVEPDAERRDTSRVSRSATSRLTPEQLLTIASRIASGMLLGNRSEIHINGPSSDIDESSVTTTQFIGGFEAGVGDIDERAVLDCVGTGLFTSRGADKFGWAHHTYAEFLAARYLRRAPLPQIKSLMTTNEAGRTYLVPQLHETAGWLAGMRPDILAWIKSTEPEVLLRSDAAKVDDVTRESLVDALLRKLASEELLDTGELRDGYHRWAHPRLGEQLALTIQDRALDIIPRRAAIDIAEECHIGSLQNVLADVALDKSEVHQIRTQAAHAVWRVGGEPSWRRLLPLAVGDGADDLDDDLRGIALRCLWPGQITVSEVGTALVPPKVDHYIGHYEMFLHDAPATITAVDLPTLLKMLSDWPAAYSHVRQLRDFQDRLMRRAWDFADHPEVAAAFAEIIAMRLRRDHHVFEFERDDPLAEKIRADADRRRLVFRSVIDGTSLRAEDCVGLFSARLLEDADALWMLDQIQMANVGRQPVWARCIWLVARTWNSAAVTDRIVTLRPSVRALSAEFDTWLDAWDLSSNEAQKAKRAYYEEKRREEKYARRLIDPPPVQRINDRLERIEQGEASEWISLTHDLTLKPTSIRVDLDLIASPKDTHGWQTADAPTRTRIVNAARTYILRYQPADAPWLGTSSLPYAIIAARKAWQLVLDDGEFIAELSSTVWDRWAPTLIGYPMHGDPWSIRAACLAYQHAASVTLDSLQTVFAGDQTVACLSALKKCWDSALTAFGMRWLKSARLRSDAFSELAELLLAVESVEAKDYLRLLINDSDWRREADEASIVTVVTLLLFHDAETSWDNLLSSLDEDSSLRPKVVSRLAGNTRHGERSFLTTLSEERLGRLYAWLSKHFGPSTSRTRHHSHKVTDGEMISDFRRTILEVLVNRGTHAACTAIRELLPALAEERQYLTWRLREAERNARRAMWRPPAVEAVISVFQVSERRYIASAADLLNVLLESLSRLQTKLRAPLPAVSDLWNYQGSGNQRQNFRPKDEEDISDYIARWFTDDLGPAQGIIANREVQPRRGQKTDIWVTATSPATSQFDTYIVVIEVKGCWNPDLWSAMKDQLLERYLGDNGLRYGIYVAGWFACERWDDNDTRKVRTPTVSIEDAQGQLKAHAAQLTHESPGVFLEAFVLDASIA